MNPEAIRIACAEKDGWKTLPCEEGDMLWPCREYITKADSHPNEGACGIIMRPPVRSRHGCEPPRYTESLDAIMPLVRKIDSTQRDFFFGYLEEIVGRDFTNLYFQVVIDATPLQIATAYLKTTGGWVV